jgi:hypothetical protein
MNRLHVLYLSTQPPGASSVATDGCSMNEICIRHNSIVHFTFIFYFLSFLAGHRWQWRSTTLNAADKRLVEQSLAFFNSRTCQLPRKIQLWNGNLASKFNQSLEILAFLRTGKKATSTQPSHKRDQSLCKDFFEDMTMTVELFSYDLKIRFN